MLLQVIVLAIVSETICQTADGRFCIYERMLHTGAISEKCHRLNLNGVLKV